RPSKRPRPIRLARAIAQYPPGPPSAAGIAHVVARPAEFAGITFEDDKATGIGLAAVIREAAARDPASLPLLSFVLDELYRRDIEGQGDNVLTYQSYGALGGLEGAIARHAETLVEQLSPAMVSALEKLLLIL